MIKEINDLIFDLTGSKKAWGYMYEESSKILQSCNYADAKDYRANGEYKGITETCEMVIRKLQSIIDKEMQALKEEAEENGKL